MLDTLAVVLVILWLLGVVSSFTAGGAIHLLLIVAVAIFLVRMLAGRRK
ncbi:MAG: lmo0937 family membrane protein [Pseudomonadota bacterium]